MWEGGDVYVKTRKVMIDNDNKESVQMDEGHSLFFLYILFFVSLLSYLLCCLGFRLNQSFIH